jgi:hypothetical protein
MPIGGVRSYRLVTVPLFGLFRFRAKVPEHFEGKESAIQTPPRSSELKSFWTIAAEDAEGPLARAMRLCVGNVGNELRKMCDDLLNEPIPPKIADLLHRLHQQ